MTRQIEAEALAGIENKDVEGVGTFAPISLTHAKQQLSDFFFFPTLSAQRVV